MAKSLRIKGRGKRAGGPTPAEPLSAYMARAPPTMPLAYSVPGLSVASTFGKDTIYAAIRSGALVAHKNGKRTIVLHPVAVDWLARLPFFNEESDDDQDQKPRHG